eukprot:jgi/Mesen1/8008/ME000425S07202
MEQCKGCGAPLGEASVNPVQWDGTSGVARFGLDIGGTLCKLVYFEPVLGLIDLDEPSASSSASANNREGFILDFSGHVRKPDRLAAGIKGIVESPQPEKRVVSVSTSSEGEFLSEERAPDRDSKSNDVKVSVVANGYHHISYESGTGSLPEHEQEVTTSREEVSCSSQGKKQAKKNPSILATAEERTSASSLRGTPFLSPSNHSNGHGCSIAGGASSQRDNGCGCGPELNAEGSGSPLGTPSVPRENAQLGRIGDCHVKKEASAGGVLAAGRDDSCEHSHKGVQSQHAVHSQNGVHPRVVMAEPVVAAVEMGPSEGRDSGRDSGSGCCTGSGSDCSGGSGMDACIHLGSGSSSSAARRCSSSASLPVPPPPTTPGSAAARACSACGSAVADADGESSRCRARRLWMPSHEPIELPGRGTLHFKRFETWRMEEFLLLSKEHSLVRGERAIAATGGGARKFGDRFLELAGLRLRRADELTCLVRGIDFLARHARDDAFEFPTASYREGDAQRPWQSPESSSDEREEEAEEPEAEHAHAHGLKPKESEKHQEREQDQEREREHEPELEHEDGWHGGGGESAAALASPGALAGDRDSAPAAAAAASSAVTNAAGAAAAPAAGSLGSGGGGSERAAGGAAAEAGREQGGGAALGAVAAAVAEPPAGTAPGAAAAATESFPPSPQGVDLGTDRGALRKRRLKGSSGGKGGPGGASAQGQSVPLPAWRGNDAGFASGDESLYPYLVWDSLRDTSDDKHQEWETTLTMSSSLLPVSLSCLGCDADCGADVNYDGGGGDDVSTFLGLATALTGCSSFAEAIDLASRGDSSNVDMLVGDIYGGDYTEMGLAASTVASSFGKLVQPAMATSKSKGMNKSSGSAEDAQESGDTTGGGDESDGGRAGGISSGGSGGGGGRAGDRMDLAKAALLMVTNNIGSLAMLHARPAGVRHILFAGSFLHGNKVGGDYTEMGLAASTVASSFGKLVQPAMATSKSKGMNKSSGSAEDAQESGDTTGGGDESDGGRAGGISSGGSGGGGGRAGDRMDLAKAALLMVTNNIGSLAMLHARPAGVRHILFAGSFLHGNKAHERMRAPAHAFASARLGLPFVGLRSGLGLGSDSKVLAMRLLAVAVEFWSKSNMKVRDRLSNCLTLVSVVRCGQSALGRQHVSGGTNPADISALLIHLEVQQRQRDNAVNVARQSNSSAQWHERARLEALAGASTSSSALADDDNACLSGDHARGLSSLALEEGGFGSGGWD